MGLRGAPAVATPSLPQDGISKAPRVPGAGRKHLGQVQKTQCGLQGAQRGAVLWGWSSLRKVNYLVQPRLRGRAEAAGRGLTVLSLHSLFCF